MSVDKKDIEHIAKLAKLKLDKNETVKYTKQMNNILGYVEKLNELDTTGVEPLYHPIERENVFREDELKPSIEREKGLMNAPKADDKFFKVPKVIKGK